MASGIFVHLSSSVISDAENFLMWKDWILISFPWRDFNGKVNLQEAKCYTVLKIGHHHEYNF